MRTRRWLYGEHLALSLRLLLLHQNCFIEWRKSTTDGTIKSQWNAATRLGLLARTRWRSPFDGSIAEVAFWNWLWTAADVGGVGTGVCPLLVRPEALVLTFRVLVRTRRRHAISRGDVRS